VTACVHCGENQMGVNDDACWWCYSVAKTAMEVVSKENARLWERLAAAERLASAASYALSHLILPLGNSGRVSRSMLERALAAWEASQ
jgi:hypothetical protein